jgi:para-nitrobenzyl esterase
VVVVTFNYRLGALGFLAHPALTAEDPQSPISGNYGFADQQAALRWVRDNVAAFGGDPANVTLFGESAGSISVCLHLVAPDSAGLFQAAIMQSGTCQGGDTMLADGESQGAVFAEAVGCDAAEDVLTCLREVAADDAVDALPLPEADFFGEGADWAPLIDGDIFGEAPAISFASGDFAHVPVILGANSQEGMLFTALAGGFSDEEYPTMAEDAFGDLADEVLAEYPLDEFASADEAVAEILTDAFFVCPTRRLARLLSGDEVSTYLYHFTHELDRGVAAGLGAFHGAELFYVFDSTTLGLAVIDAEQPLVDTIQGYWSRLAATGDPNGDDAVVWPAYDAETDQHIILDLEVAVGSALKTHRCDFWDSL